MFDQTAGASFQPHMDGGPPLPLDPRASLGRALRLLWRQRLAFVLAVLPILLAGAVTVLVLPESFTARATMIVGIRQPAIAAPEQLRDAARAEPDIDGAVELIRSPAALRAVATRLGLADRPEFQLAATAGEPGGLTGLRHRVARWLGRKPAAAPREAGQPVDPTTSIGARLRAGLKVDRVGRSNIVAVSYSAADPDFAAAVANALATFSAEDDGFLGNMTLADQARYQLVGLSVIAAATPPLDPSAPNIPVILAATLVCAAGAGLTAALLRDFRQQQTVLSAEELARRGLRPLGLLPDFGVAEAGVTARAFAAPGNAAFADALSSLVVAVLPLNHDKARRGMVLLVTSALQAEGKSTTAAALATSIAAAGRKVLLVDADLRAPMVHRLFGAAATPGLADQLLGDGDLDGAICKDPATGVAFLPAGVCQPRVLEVLGSQRLRTALESWRAAYDVILIDSPPVLAVGDSRVLAGAADQTVFVARWGRTGWAPLMLGLRLVAEGGGSVAGVILSRVNVRRLADYDDAGARIYGPDHGGRAALQEARNA